MAIIVEDGTGLSTAESYISVAYANAYFSRRNNATWDALDDSDEKEPAIIAATDYLQRTYKLRWKGYRGSDTQALDWPREEVPNLQSGGDDWQDYYANDAIPTEIKNAACELALRAAAGELAPDIAPDAFASQVSVGPISVTYKPGSPSVTSYRTIEAMLAPFLVGNGTFGMARLVRT